ncbi:MAG: SCP2 sterol-binding domain-containing protein [Lachnospiraceae bacterium]|nr:SCP2 sterol-binding domain-containing protein [Lachnospiraceae bacterium]
MKVNVYYGGRGLIEDPTLFVVERMVRVLEELRVTVNRYNMYEDKAGIATLPNTLKDCDGVILASSLEWFGIGGYMQQFLDMCWLYADKSRLSNIYMMPVVVATAYGEQDAELTLRKAWDVLGGISLNGLATYVDSQEVLEKNNAFLAMIEKKAEDLYRSINQKAVKFPTSNTAVKNNLIKKANISLTPQESEQLSKFVSNDGYVKQQKEDIEELSAMFKQMLGVDTEASVPEYKDEIIEAFSTHYHAQPGFKAKYVLLLPDSGQTLVIRVGDAFSCEYDEDQEADVKMRLSYDMIKSIISGKMTFQKGFMSGEITAKGNFKTLRMLDQIFRFGK